MNKIFGTGGAENPKNVQGQLQRNHPEVSARIKGCFYLPRGFSAWIPGRRSRAFSWVFFVLTIGWCFCSTGMAGAPSPAFRFGFSHILFTDVNENDAMAAVKTWAKELAKDRGISADPDALIFQNSAEISQALKAGTVDGVTVSTLEYMAIRKLVSHDTVAVSVTEGSITEEYVLLVHKDSGIQGVDDLRGTTLGLLVNMRTCLAPVWLDVLLDSRHLSPAADFFKAITSAAKIDKLVYQVFFHQRKACLVTRKGFKLMVELNPQMGQQLKVLEKSPPVVPSVSCFRKDTNSSASQKVKSEMANWNLSPAGRQILTLFQTDSVQVYPVSCLDSTLELIAEHTRLTGKVHTRMNLNENKARTAIDEQPTTSP